MAMTVPSAASDEQIVPDQGGLLVLEQLHDDPDLLEVVMCLAADVTNGEAADVTTHQVRYMFFKMFANLLQFISYLFRYCSTHFERFSLLLRS